MHHKISFVIISDHMWKGIEQHHWNNKYWNKKQTKVKYFLRIFDEN